MNKLFSSVQSFIHSVTTPDRYASYEGGYKNSSLSNGPGSSGLNPSEGLVSSNNDEEEFSQVGIMYSNASSSSLDRLSTENNPRPDSSDSRRSSASSARVQYTPGIRSNQVGNGGVQLQDYANGTPPPPSPAVSWKRIERWLDSNFPELYECMNEPATSADLNELEADLDCSLPLDVRDSYQIHDGQESGGRPAGLFFGIYFLGLEEISSEWDIWKNTAVKINAQLRAQKANHQAAAAEASSSAYSQSRHMRPARPSWLDRQECVPEGTVQKVYAHPGWIPLARDNEGNNIAVDLAPGPNGRWGQVILFGREFDRKYVVAPSWAAFLALYADDLEAGHSFVNEELEEAEFLFQDPNGRLVRYLNVLRAEVDRKYRQPRRQAPPPVPTPQSSKIGAPLSAAATARRKDSGAGSSRPGTPNSGKLISSSPNASQGKLISPVQSSFNLAASATEKEKNPDNSSPLKESVSAEDISTPALAAQSDKESELIDDKSDEDDGKKLTDESNITISPSTEATNDSSPEITVQKTAKKDDEELADVDI